ncbi:hypothetical protein PTKIN_Ptkin11bG0137200 [Pterospermum kingtungense]
MEINSDHGNICESSFGGADRKVEALDLLEESWFFENLFTRRTRMLRCYSDPCTSSNFSQEVLAKDSCSQISESSKKFEDKGSVHCSLIRTPSLPPCIGREEKVQERKISNGGRSKLNRQLSLQASKTSCTKKILEIQEKKTDAKSKLSGQSSRRNLLRMPSLPTSYRTELIQDNDSDIRMSKLIRQALANSSEILPPAQNPNKLQAMGQSYSVQRCRPPRNLELKTSSNTNVVQEMRRRYPNQKVLQKSYSDLAFQELQGFKDLGFTFDKEDLSPGVVNILPGLQENKMEDLEQDKVIRRPYLSEAWHVQSLAPPIPNCESKNSAKDMKAQLKFWARAVATNVRQEC